MAVDETRGSFGDWLFDLLSDTEMSYRELGRRIDVHPSTVGHWVSGRSIPDPPNCRKLADVFGLDPDDVLDRVGHRRLQPFERRLVDENRQLRQAVVALQTTNSTLANVIEASDEWDFRALMVPVIGEVAAGGIRLGSEDRDEAVPVLMDPLSRAQQPKALVVTGECMRTIGILPGDFVVIDRDPHRKPADRDLVVIRLDGGLTFKRWCVVSQYRVELRDGDDEVAAIINPLMDDYAVEGVYVTFVPRAPR